MRSVLHLTDAKVKKAVWAGILGNTLELYDYTIYAFFSAILATEFFPSEDPLASLMATYGVYASGFLLRPLGALLLGSIGDRFGRKKALEISILLMAIPTLCMGFLPTYYQAGILGPILLIVMRMLQGISIGGELVGSYTYLVEHADEDQKGFVGSWSLVGAFGGKWFGTFVAMLMTLFVSSPFLENWGWRIAFISGIVFTAIGYYLRKRVSETPVFKALQHSHHIDKSPLKTTLKSATPAIVLSAAILALHTSALHLIFVYFPIYFKSILGFSYAGSLLSNLGALTIAIIILPLSGKLSDQIGRRPILLFGAICLTLLIYPAFVVISQGDLLSAIPMHLLLAATCAMMYGPFPATMMELFPPQIRCTGASIAYNLSVGVFGGLTPVIVTWLISYFDNPTAPSIWLILCGLITIAGTCKLKKTNPVFADATT